MDRDRHCIAGVKGIANNIISMPILLDAFPFTSLSMTSPIRWLAIPIPQSMCVYVWVWGLGLGLS